MKDKRGHHAAGLLIRPGPDRKRFKGGGTQVTKTDTTSEPWSEQKPFLTQGFEGAQRLLEGDKPSFFPGTTVTPYSPETEEAFGLRTGAARDPGSLLGLAGGETARTLRGDYLDPQGSFMQGILGGVRDVVRPGVDTQFAGAQRFGSPGHAEAMARGVTTGMLPFISGERARQYGAVGQAYPVSQYAPSQLEAVGGAREALSRDVKQEELDRFNFGENVEALKLQQFMQNITGNYGGTTTGTTTQPTFSNPLMTGLGAASSLAGIGSAMFAPAGGGGFMTGKG